MDAQQASSRCSSSSRHRFASSEADDLGHLLPISDTLFLGPVACALRSSSSCLIAQALFLLPRVRLLSSCAWAIDQCLSFQGDTCATAATPSDPLKILSPFRTILRVLHCQPPPTPVRELLGVLCPILQRVEKQNPPFIHVGAAIKFSELQRLAHSFVHTSRICIS